MWVGGANFEADVIKFIDFQTLQNQNFFLQLGFHI